MKEKKTKKGAKVLALTILLGVFISTMLTIFINLAVSYSYPGPEYEDYCSNGNRGIYPVKVGYEYSANCTFSKTLQEQQDACYEEQGQPVFEYDDKGCSVTLKECDLCNKEYNDDLEIYNRKVFFIFAIVGFALIVFGLFNSALLLQIVSLPAGAFLVIEAAVKNFDDKLAVIITFGLLIIAALYLSLRKLKLK